MIFDAITIHDLHRPLRARLEMRRTCGPSTWNPPQAPSKGRGFYLASEKTPAMGPSNTLDLRVSWADDHLPRSSRLHGVSYWCDEYGDGETMRPLVARLPHGRGFLAGWSMGPGMCGSLDSEIHPTPEDAARAAHSMAEADAEAEREYQARERERIDAEEAAAARRADEVAGLGTDE